MGGAVCGSELQLALGRSGGTASAKTAAPERWAPVTHPLYPSVGDAPILSDELMLLACFPLPLPAGEDAAAVGGFFWGGGYCRRDPNGQHLPLSGNFFFFFLFLRAAGTEGVGRVGARWVIYLLTPPATQLSQLLPLCSSNFLSTPICPLAVE